MTRTHAYILHTYICSSASAGKQQKRVLVAPFSCLADRFDVQTPIATQLEDRSCSRWQWNTVSRMQYEKNAQVADSVRIVV